MSEEEYRFEEFRDLMNEGIIREAYHIYEMQPEIVGSIYPNMFLAFYIDIKREIGEEAVINFRDSWVECVRSKLKSLDSAFEIDKLLRQDDRGRKHD
jgi:hypothetical protein